MAKPRCDLPSFRVEHVDTVVWDFVRNLILNPQSLRVMMEDSQKEMQERNADLMVRLARIKDRIEKERKRLAILLREYTEIDIEDEGKESEAKTFIHETY